MHPGTHVVYAPFGDAVFAIPATVTSIGAVRVTIRLANGHSRNVSPKSLIVQNAAPTRGDTTATPLPAPAKDVDHGTGSDVHFGNYLDQSIEDAALAADLDAMAEECGCAKENQ